MLLLNFLKAPKVEIFLVENLLFPKTQYHGGTNFGRTAGGPFITTSYDYDAPLDEYGIENHTITIINLCTYYLYLF